MAACLHGPVRASADCYFVYDEGFRASYQRASGMILPRKAGHLSSMAECQATLHGMLSDPQYSGDVGLGRTRCECYDDGGEVGLPGGGGPQGGTIEQQIVSRLVSSLLGALLSGLQAPPGPDGEAIRKKLQKQWDDEEGARRVFEKKREKEAFEKAHQVATGLLGNRPAGADGATAGAAPGADGVYIGTGTVPSLLRASGAVSAVEWAEARAWQARIDALRSKGALTAAEARELAALEARRNALWGRAVSVPGLTQRDRDALRLKLHVANGAAVTASVDDLLEAREQASRDPARIPVHPLTTMVESSVTSGIKTAFETAGEAGAEELGKTLAGKGKNVLRWGEAYGLGAVAVAVVRDRPEDTAEPMIGWGLGKVVAKAPTLGLGVGTAQMVGTATTTVARRSIEQLVEVTDQVVPILAPGETGEDWWKERKAEMTPGQRWVTEGLGL